MQDNGEPGEVVMTMEKAYSEAEKQEGPKQTEAKTAAEETKVEKKKASFMDAVHNSGLVAAKTVAGVGIGAAAGIGAVVAISIAEITIPTLLVLQIFGFAGGALGFLKGMSKK